MKDPGAGVGSEAPLLGTHISEKAAFQCTTCGGCEYQCPVGIQHLPVIIGLRRGAVNTGKWEDEYGTKLFLNMERTGNSLGFASSERQKFIERAELPLFDGSQEYCLWLGCMGAYDPHGREIVQALAKVLRHAGITFGVLRKERCNGDPARRLGNDLLFTQLAEQGIETLAAAAPKKIVSICPHCVRTLSNDWREAGQTFAIEHHSEVLARVEDRLPQPTAAREKIAYHDPCYLGRYRNVYDEPRAIVDRYAEVVEAPAPSRAVLLLRRRRRPDVPRRGRRQARQCHPRAGTGRYRRGGHRRGLSVLPEHVSRRPRASHRSTREASRHRADRRRRDRLKRVAVSVCGDALQLRVAKSKHLARDREFPR